ncbi:MAG TPA: glycine betaine ABC transporter substrate-binding protein, partial [Solirubrobacteraceae bacterium]|nr:glycine betaine ABC transporter substrate-binding protein [Solirubrobacteraceae bacterium]
MKGQFRFLLALVAVLTAGVLLAACGGGEQQGSGQQGGSAQGGGQSGQQQNLIQPVANAPQKTITVGSKNFDEQYILGEIYAQALE